MEKKKTGYAEAIREIELILEKFSNEELDVDTLAAEVKKATELIKICKQRLHKAETDVEEILRNE